MKKETKKICQVMAVLGSVGFVTFSALNSEKQVVEVSVSPSEFKKSIGFESFVDNLTPIVDIGYEEELQMRTASKVLADEEIERTLEKIKQEENEKRREENEVDLLARLVRAEAGNQSLDGKRAVVDVVLNRVDSSVFPDTISEVIYQPGQFSCVKDGNWDKAARTVDESDYEAVRLEMEERTDSEIMFFSSGSCANGVYVYSIGDHYFAKLK